MRKAPISSKTIQLSDITFDPENARKHTKRNIDTIQTAIEELGAGRSILIDENNRLIAGEGTVRAARKAGKTKVLIVDTDQDTLVAVRRTDLSPENKRRMGLFDNRAADLAGGFDMSKISDFLAEDDSTLDGMFTGDEINKLMSELEVTDDTDTDTDTDTEARPEGNKNRTRESAVVHYDIIFDDVEQQSRFHTFLRYIKQQYADDPALDTVSARIDAFIRDQIG